MERGRRMRKKKRERRRGREERERGNGERGGKDGNILLNLKSFYARILGPEYCLTKKLDTKNIVRLSL